MCGIVGLWNMNGEAAEITTLKCMIGTIRHRGPDDNGIHTEANLGLAHARLSIIDPAGGHQPMSIENGAFWITFNGEIFNYLELKEEMVRQGIRFATNSDTEVILQYYRLKGERCVEDFEGQWAFAIWDARENKLFLSRDRLGVRPLFYSMQNARFAFASEIKALLMNPDIPRELDRIALDQTFTFWSAVPPRTIFQGVHELPPAHSISIRDGVLKTYRYWQIQYSSEPVSDREAEERLFSLLVDATRLRLRADVPVGAYLSGGLDSSVVAALIRRFSGASLKVFSIRFDDPEFDEGRYQKEVGHFLGVDRHDIRCSPHLIGQVFPEAIWHAERPILRTAPAPLLLLSKLARDHDCKVVLTGEGADEMFGGYDIFKEAKIRAFWASYPDSRLRPRLLSRLYPYLPNIHAQSPQYLKTFFQVTPEDLLDPFFSHLPRWGMTSKLKMFFSDDVKEASASTSALGELERALPAGFSSWDPFHRAQYLETAFLMPGYILSSQGDRMAMAHGVETRFPFLDSRVVALAAGLPLRLKMKVLNEKYILKSCAKDLVPDSVRKRSKQPYRAPDAACFFGGARGLEYVNELLEPEQLRRDKIFNPAAVHRLIGKFQRNEAIGVRDNMAMVGILSTQLVLRQFIDRQESYRATRIA
jgi:asparagine synthase (glutamine-hydrolysing)